MVDSAFSNPQDEYYANFSSDNMVYFLYQDDEAVCNLTTHWDPRSSNILGWYVEEDDYCTHSDWTYSQAYSNDTGDYLSGPDGSFLMAVDKQVFESFVSSLASESLTFESLEDDEEYYVPATYEFDSYYD